MSAPQTLVLASANRKKAAEIRALLPDWELLSLDDVSFSADIPEPYATFEENAFTKAATVHANCGLPVLADDSGLCVDALDGAPGVHSARYAGTPSDDTRNWQKLLQDLRQAEYRAARFVTVICLVGLGAPRYFRGSCDGRIAFEARGTNGFGYDPVFIPVGYDRTMAELSPDEKARISHRAEALQQLRQAFTPLSF